MTNPYNKYLLPKITHFVCQAGPNMKQRIKVVPQASGQVLEIGAGSGLNFKFYDQEKVEHLFALDPSEEMWSIAESSLEKKTFAIEFIKGFAEQIPLEDNAVDTILTTYTLCTIGNLEASFKEMRRVLKPGGSLIFCEHGKAPDKSVRRWQNGINPIWKRLGGGCSLIRDIPQIIEDGAFHIEKLDTMYLPGFKFASYNYWGVARPM